MAAIREICSYGRTQLQTTWPSYRFPLLGGNWTYVSNAQSPAQTANYRKYTVYLYVFIFWNVTIWWYLHSCSSHKLETSDEIKLEGAKMPWCAIALLVIALSGKVPNFLFFFYFFEKLLAFQVRSLTILNTVRPTEITQWFMFTFCLITSLFCAGMHQQEAKHTCGHMRWRSGGPDFSFDMGLIVQLAQQLFHAQTTVGVQQV